MTEEPEQKPETAKPLLSERYLNFVEDFTEKKLTEESNKLSRELDALIDTKVKEVSEIVAVALGVKKKAEVISALRKATLENTKKERSPITADTTPEGNKPENPIDKAFKEWME